ncbi:hypothetical protein FACS1894179_10420 [Bacteroidia bacterium]|nr:hypothetical protein FACS1894179_10420 [Bacteroidia bacterium]
MNLSAWTLFLSGSIRSAVISSAVILRDAFSGKHYMELSAAQERYEACMGKVYEVVPDTEVPNIDNEEPLLLEKTNQHK